MSATGTKYAVDTKYTALERLADTYESDPSENSEPEYEDDSEYTTPLDKEETKGEKHRLTIAIVGCISSGKSTLLNAMFAERYADMKRIRTTMVPHMYVEDNDSAINPDKIYEANTKHDRSIYDKSLGDAKLTAEQLKPVVHRVKEMRDRLGFDNDIALTVVDLPGVNDSRTRDTYMNLIKQSFINYDVVFMIVDVTSAFNTTDEKDMLMAILKNIINNRENGVFTMLVIIVNKCDGMKNTSSGYEPNDEDKELIKQIRTIAKACAVDVKYDREIPIVPMSAKEAYINNLVALNKKGTLDDELIDYIGLSEFGKTGWNRLNTEEKKQRVVKLMKDNYTNANRLESFSMLRKEIGSRLCDHYGSISTIRLLKTNTVRRDLSQILATQEVKKGMCIRADISQINQLNKKYSTVISDTCQIPYSPMYTMKAYMAKYYATIFSNDISAKPCTSNIQSYNQLRKNLEYVVKKHGNIEWDIKSSSLTLNTWHRLMFALGARTTISCNNILTKINGEVNNYYADLATADSTPFAMRLDCVDSIKKVDKKRSEVILRLILSDPKYISNMDMMPEIDIKKTVVHMSSLYFGSTMPNIMVNWLFMILEKLYRTHTSDIKYMWSKYGHWEKVHNIPDRALYLKMLVRRSVNNMAERMTYTKPTGSFDIEKLFLEYEKSN